MMQALKGSLVALVTPMTMSGDIDYESLKHLIDWHIDQGTDGIVSVGTTGESATVNITEHIKVIEYTVKCANSRIPVIAGTGANSTLEAIELTMESKRVGADCALIVTPYYNKPTQEGLYQHYKSINDNTSLPIIIYNIPSRCVIDMSVDTMARLYELKNIAGVKDATGDLNRLDQTLKKLGPDFIQLTGEDGLAFEFNKRGGVGIISVTANIAPKLCSDFQKFSKSNSDNEIKEAERIDALLQPLHKALFIESNPAPAKYAAKLLGLCSDDVRLPLVKIQESTKEKVKEALLSAKLL